jgi:hypothetical protein
VRRHGVEHREQPRAVAGDDIPAHQRALPPILRLAVPAFKLRLQSVTSNIFPENTIFYSRGALGKGPANPWTISADSTVIRAYQHAAGARRALPADLVTGGGGE